MVEYSCLICNKKYATYQTLWTHNKKFHKSDPIQTKKTEEKKYSCTFCNKDFKLRQYRWKHEKICKKNNKDIIELKNKINELEKHIIDKVPNNIVNNINNGSIINNITINNFGNESITNLTYEEIKKIAKKNINCLLYITKLLNFNEKYPENHSFCTTSLEGNYVTVYNKDKKILEKKNKNDFYDIVLLNSINKINDLIFHLEFTDDINKKKLGKKYIAKLENIINNNEYIYSNRHKKIYKTNINEISYNKKDTILNTWNKELNNNILSNLESSDSDASDSDSSCDIKLLLQLNAK